MITQRVSTKILLALAVSSAVLLAGCSGGSTAQAPQAPAPAPAAETPTPTVPALTPPILSTQSRQPSQAGAEAFVQYWWDLYSYAHSANDALALQKLSSAECNYCNKTLADIESWADAGLTREGGNVRVDAITLEREIAGPAFVFLTKLHQDAFNTFHEDGTLSSHNESEASELYIWVTWEDTRWVMREVAENLVVQ